jgi:spermidine/putrescine transport system substrate-binding protein
MEGDLDRALARRLGRREFLRYSAILGGVGVLAACKKAETSGGGAPGSPRPPVSQEPGDLQIFDWAGYEVKPLWRPYANQYPGQTPRWTTYKDDQFGYSKIAANPDAADFDVVHPCHYYWSDYLKLTRSDGSPILQAWDTSLIENFSQLNPAFIQGGQFDGRQYFVPIDWGLAAPLYRPDKVEPTEDSWALLWDERYKGRIAWWESFNMFIPAAYVNGIEDPWNMTDDQLDLLKSFLISKKKAVDPILWSIDPTTETMANGDAWIAYAWPLHYVELQSTDYPGVYMNPKEGRTAWYCGFALVDGTENYYHAHDYVNAWISAQSGQWLVTNYAYGSLNTAIDISKVPKDLVQVFSLDDPQALAEPNSHPEQDIPRRSVYQAMWDEVKAA